MKKSISVWSFGGPGSLADKLRLAKDAGFAGFEIDLSEDGPVNLRSTPTELKAVRALVKDGRIDGVIGMIRRGDVLTTPLLPGLELPLDLVFKD